MLRLLLIDIIEGTRISLKSLLSNKVRSILTTLGIIIGIVAVTTMSTAIVGIRQAFTDAISKLGNDVLYIDKFEWLSNRNYFEARNRKDIDFEQYLKLRENLSVPAYVSPLLRSFGKSVKYEGKSINADILVGTSNEYEKTSSSVPEFGRFFNEMEYNANRNVCVIGKSIAENLFEGVNPLNKKIKVGGIHLEIIGILEKQGGGLFGGNMIDGQIIMPLRIFEKISGNRNGSLRIEVKVVNIADLEDAKEEVRYLMRSYRKVPVGKKDDFAINQQEAFTKAYDDTVGKVAIAGLVITALALFVGAIGIMNIMFVSVTERTREIGIRKAIGAKRATILLQFLIEAAVLCMMGGIIGLMVSFPLSLVIDQILPTALPLDIVVLALGISALVGIISGILPAIKASRLDPVEALRYE